MSTTVDAVCRGALLLEQPKRGYRYNIDALLLALFARQVTAQPPHQVIDLGAGSGVVGLLLGRWWPAASVTLIELQPPLAALARANAVRNGLAARTTVFCGHLRRAAMGELRPGPGALLVSNPPFFGRDTGRVSPREELALARHELSCSLAEWLAAARRLLSAGGRLAMIHLAEREAEVAGRLAEAGFSLLGRRVVRPQPRRGAHRILLHAHYSKRSAAQPGPPGLSCCGGLPTCETYGDLLVEDPIGAYSPEVASLLSGIPGPPAGVPAGCAVGPH